MENTIIPAATVWKRAWQAFQFSLTNQREAFLLLLGVNVLGILPQFLIGDMEKENIGLATGVGVLIWGIIVMIISFWTTIGVTAKVIFEDQGKPSSLESLAKYAVNGTWRWIKVGFWSFYYSAGIPLLTLLAVFLAYAAFNFAINLEVAPIPAGTVQIVNYVLGFVGLLAVIGLILRFPYAFASLYINIATDQPARDSARESMNLVKKGRWWRTVGNFLAYGLVSAALVWIPFFILLSVILIAVGEEGTQLGSTLTSLLGAVMQSVNTLATTVFGYMLYKTYATEDLQTTSVN